MTKLCIDCKFYRPGANEIDDKCGHGRAYREPRASGVRGSAVAAVRYTCTAMRAGICGDGDLFEERTCECGATLQSDETTCSSCTAKYRAEERQELDRKFPPQE